MDLVLKREVKVEVYQVIMQIGRQKQREDILAVLKLAEDLNKPLKPKDICKNLLIDRPESMGEAILLRCKDLDLLDDNFNLTEIGRKALRESKIFLKEESCYTLYITRDPIHLDKFLHLKTISPKSEEMRVYTYLKKNEYDEKNANLSRDIIETPQFIIELKNKIFINSNKKIIIYDVGKKAKYLETFEKEKLYLIVKIEDIFNNPKLSVYLSDFRSGELENIPYLDPLKIWLSLLGDKSDKWDFFRKVLRVKYSELKEDEKLTFKKNFLEVIYPEIPGLGKFESIKIPDIPIIPDSYEDAEKWAEWYLIY
ncbi:MAG: hypothetical protein ACTSQP_24490, partial [Promethearchaeota archaeon]